MPDLLNHEEYLALARTLDYSVNAFIDGRFQGARSGATFNSINPATGALLAKVAACNGDDIDRTM